MAPATISKEVAFELEQDYILVNFASEYTLVHPRSVYIRFVLEAKGIGTIAACRVGQNGWCLQIDHRGKLVFYSDSQKLESHSIEPLHEKTCYTIKYELENPFRFNY